MSLATLLLIAAFILFLLATFNTNVRINLTAAGLACVVASLLMPLVRG